MAKYFFIPGRYTELSLAELKASLDAVSLGNASFSFEGEALIVDPDDRFELAPFFVRLGGFVKAGRIIRDLDLDSSSEDFTDIFKADFLLENFFLNPEGKIHFGISLYNCGLDRVYFRNIQQNLHNFSISIKEELNKRGRKSGFVRMKERSLSSVSVDKNGLLKKGGEIVLIARPKGILAARTEIVQNYEAFYKRDFLKPHKNLKSGIMPAKLARIMINLSGIKKGGFLLDPFCGGGTIALEALDMGITNIFASDISLMAVNETKRNIEWFLPVGESLNNMSYNIRVGQADAGSMNIYSDGLFDAVVTEPYLGETYDTKPDLGKITETLSKLERLYQRSFGEFARVLKTGGRLSIVLPVFGSNGKLYYIDSDKLEKESGLQRVKLNCNIESGQERGYDLERQGILISSPGQHVKREILIFEK